MIQEYVLQILTQIRNIFETYNIGYFIITYTITIGITVFIASFYKDLFPRFNITFRDTNLIATIKIISQIFYHHGFLK